MAYRAKILVIDDDEAHRSAMVVMLEDEEYAVDEAENGESALQMLERHSYDLIITDFKMHKIDGMELLKMINDRDPLQKVIMVTGYGSIEHAVEAIHNGALNYIPKPVDPKKLKQAIEKALTDVKAAPARTVTRGRSPAVKSTRYDQIIGQSRAVKQNLKKIQEIADIDVPVLITGESGTGKELVARAIHQSSTRAANGFIAVNTGAIARDLILSELFGHEKGSFTGAVEQKKGKFEEANGGTLFLDEISTMSPEVQVALLRVLENRTIDRVGGRREIPVDVRIVAATNENLEECIDRRTFREDLYYRMNVFAIELAPLRERKEDIPLLCSHFINVFNGEYKRQVSGIEDDALAALVNYSWRGNIRELRNVIIRSMISAGKKIKKSDLPLMILEHAESSSEIRIRTGTSLPDIERDSIIQTLRKVKGNKARAAEILGISRRSLYNKIADYQILDSEYK